MTLQESPLLPFRNSQITGEATILTLIPQISFPCVLDLAHFTQPTVSRLICVAIHKFSLFVIIANIPLHECITIINEHVQSAVGGRQSSHTHPLVPVRMHVCWVHI